MPMLARVLLLASLGVAAPSVADDYTDARDLVRTGQYEQAVAATDAGIRGRRLRESWWVLRLEMLRTLGRYDQAAEQLETALASLPQSIRLRWIGVDIVRMAGQSDRADELLTETGRLIASQAWRYRINGDDLITLGRIRLADGVDPKQVLEEEFALAQRRTSSRVDGLIACGQLALDKEDFALAADYFGDAAKLAAGHPEIQYGLARAFFPSDAGEAATHLQTALGANPRHIPSLLLAASRSIDGERYDDADQQLDDVLAINAKHPLAWAYKAVLAHLNADEKAEAAAIEAALATWPQNPEVPHAIGQKLSRKYRFAEGERFQRQALDMDPGYEPARVQLAQDLLRLGREEEGWELAEQIAQRDPYNVLAYNLATLRDELTGYTIISDGRFRVRMQASEADLYGPRVIELLREAESTLAGKYAVTLPEVVDVDIYARQADFAIRTFGLPGGIGYLGVCFGPVITMNSPAAITADVSWESVLWHEFTHTVTLSKTRNRMPRWLSEGISVYEERRADPRWGQSITPAFAAMLSGDDLTPVSKLSDAFLSPKSGEHLQLAYYESSLVVEYLVDAFGLPALLAVLDDLGRGLAINDALSRHTVPIEQLDEAFRLYVGSVVQAYAPDASFEDNEQPWQPDAAATELTILPGKTNVPALLRELSVQQTGGETEAALRSADQLLALFPNDAPVSVLRSKAALLKTLGRDEPRDAVLRRIAEQDAGAIDVFRELMSRSGDPAAIARDLLAVDPFSKDAHRVRADAARDDDRPDDAITSLLAIAALRPYDPAALHYEIATLCQSVGRRADAHRHLLLALEEAPRYRDAQVLLLKLIDDSADSEAVQ